MLDCHAFMALVNILRTVRKMYDPFFPSERSLAAYKRMNSPVPDIFESVDLNIVIIFLFFICSLLVY